MNPWPPTDTPFKAGQSGNPGGRPKGIRRALLRAAKYSPKAVDTLHEIMTDESQPVMARIAAANLILDRGIGKPQPAQVEQPPPLAFYQPLTEEQVQLAERDGEGAAGRGRGETAGGNAEAMSPGGASESSAVLRLITMLGRSKPSWPLFTAARRRETCARFFWVCP